MGRRNDHSREEIRDMALEAAIRLLERDGLAGLSARRIASEIGYTVGTLYLVFHNLDDVMMQVNLRTLRAMRDCLWSSIQNSDTPARQLKSMAAAYIEFARQNEHRWRLLHEHRATQAIGFPEEYQQITTSLFDRLEAIMAQMVQINQHLLPQLSRAIWGSVHGICVLALAGKLGQPGNDKPEDLAEILLQQLMGVST